MPIIKQVKGNLIKLFKNGDFNEIVHGCNCFHTMGAGIAGQIAEEFPEAVRADRATKRGDIAKLGTFSIAEPREGFIVNLYSQYEPGREPRIRLYKSLEEGFARLNEMTSNPTDNPQGWKTGIPMIGAGIAGGFWPDIQRIIDSVTPNMAITLVEWDGK